MGEGRFEACEFSWDGEHPLSKEVEVASIFCNVVLKRQGERRLLSPNDTPERISFISKLYFPLKILNHMDISFALSTSFFNRSIKDYRLDKNKIDSGINGILNDKVAIEDFKRFNELLGKKGFFDRIIGKENENYTQFQIRGGYPDNYPNSFLDEFKFIRSTSNLPTDGIVFPQNIPDHILENSVKKLKNKLDEIELDIQYLYEKKEIVSNIANTLNKQKDRINEYYRQLQSEALEDCYRQDTEVSIEAARIISAIDKEFESSINIFSRYYPLLNQGLTNPTEFGGWPGLAGDADLYKKSDSRYQVAAANLLSKIRTCKNIVSRLKLEQGGYGPETANFISKVYKMMDDTEDKLYNHLNGVKSTVKEIWAKEEVIRNKWNSEIKQIDDRINGILKEQGETLKRIDLIVTHKNSIIKEIKANIALDVNFQSDKIYIPFWIACLSKQSEHRFLVYGPMRKRRGKGPMDALQGYAMPLEPYSKGVERLGAEIEIKLRKDKKLAERIIIEGSKFNKLNAQHIELAVRGLEILKNEGWIRDKRVESIIKSLEV